MSDHLKGGDCYDHIITTFSHSNKRMNNSFSLKVSQITYLYDEDILRPYIPFLITMLVALCDPFFSSPATVCHTLGRRVLLFKRTLVQVWWRVPKLQIRNKCVPSKLQYWYAIQNEVKFYHVSYLWVLSRISFHPHPTFMTVLCTSHICQGFCRLWLLCLVWDCTAWRLNEVLFY